MKNVSDAMFHSRVFALWGTYGASIWRNSIIKQFDIFSGFLDSSVWLPPYDD
jgi:hypothetical protein